MSDADIAFEPVTSLALRLARRELSAGELTELYLKRIAGLADKTCAFITVSKGRARDAAKEANRRWLTGKAQHPLCGMPFAAKDLFDIAGEATTAGSRVLADNIAETTATAVERLQAPGAVCLGKTNLHEFAYGATGENALHGTPVNAYDHTRIAGGSSSGSAAAVAFGLAPMALGTDTGGSVRAPAALSGIVGLKPTHGRISVAGVIPFAWSADDVGTLTRTVRDAAVVLKRIAGADARDPSAADVPVGNYPDACNRGVRRLRIGVPETFFFDNCQPGIAEAVDDALRLLEHAGARLVPVAMPDMTHVRTVALTIQMPEALSYHSRYLETRGDLYGDDFRAGLALGQCILAEHYVRARRMVTHFRQKMAELFETIDVLVTPTTPVVAPPVGASTIVTGDLTEPAGNAIMRFTSSFNLTGHPAISVPAGLNAEGLPMAAQIIARPFDEETMFAVAAAINEDEAFQLPRPGGDRA